MVMFTYSTDYDVTYNHGNADGWILKVAGAAGISEKNNSASFTVFPNPSSDKIFLDFPYSSEKFNIRILDLTGKMITEINSSEKNLSTLELNISGLKNGKYFILLNAGDKIYHSVFVKE
jgi:hypothetical protein